MKVVEKQESLLVLNEDAKCIETAYAWNEDVHRLKDNLGQVISFQKTIEKKLVKNNEIDLYNQEVQKVIDKGHLVMMDPEEIKNHDGPVSYVSHHPVYKDSKSTPICLVTNSSLKNRTCGLSPNDCMGKPPNALSSQFSVFLR